jgi:hypothetical protein
VLDRIFWATLGFIFLVTIVGAFVRLRRRDVCLALFSGHHVTLAHTNARTVWGRMRAYAQGIELIYSVPYQTPYGLYKAGYLLYQSEMGNLLALCRYVGHLTPEEQALRAAQVAQRVNPRFRWRFQRGLRNVFNTIRDAFSRAFSAFVGQIAKVTGSPVLVNQQKDVDQLGQTLFQAAGNAYEPMLEKHIGHPVILEITDPRDPNGERTEVFGHLAEYSENFVALFNADTGEEPEFAVDDAAAPSHGVSCTLDEQGVTLTNLIDIPLAVRALVDGDGRERRIGAALLRGTQVRLPRPAPPFRFLARRAPRVDLVCPRQIARIRYASLEDGAAADDALAPAHADRHAQFP